MQYRMISRVLFLVLVSSVLWSCGDDDSPGAESDGFDRAVMLTNWADNIIIPAYAAYAEELAALNGAKNTFNNESSVQNLEILRSAWLDAYIAWQNVSLFEIGKAEELTLRDFTNIFPTDASAIETNISTGTYNLELSSTRDEQGFPALDYLLFGIADTDQGIVNLFEQNANYGTYLNDVVTRLNNLTDQVIEDWNADFRDEFIANDGSSAGSSVNKLVNDYMFYYEKALRAGKIGIPAGVFSNTPLSDRVEGFYSKEHSKVLFETALQATIDFFNGRHFSGSGSGQSLNSYLDFLNTIADGEDLATLINNQFQAAQETGELLGNNFFEEVKTNNGAMLNAYDGLQANVPLLKVDMFNALNVKVDFVDADGD